MRRTTKLLVIIATAVSTVAFAGTGWAYWSSHGTGSGTATASSWASVAGVSSTSANGSFKAGTVIPITVTFSASVTVTGTPQLTLSTGTPATTAVNYTSGSGTSVLIFNYTVAAGNTSADLNYAATTSLALNGGTIKDAAPQNATLTLPGLTAAGSLGTSKDLVIDTTAPTVTGVALANGGTAQKADAGDTVTITYSEQLDATKLCSTWLNSGNPSLSNASVSVADDSHTSNDQLTVATATCTFNLGTVHLGGDYMANNKTAVFTSSTVAWNPTAHTLTVTLGTQTGDAPNTSVTAGKPGIGPASGLTDLAGNGLGTGLFTSGSTSGF